MSHTCQPKIPECLVDVLTENHLERDDRQDVTLLRDDMVSLELKLRFRRTNTCLYWFLSSTTKGMSAIFLVVGKGLPFVVQTMVKSTGLWQYGRLKPNWGRYYLYLRKRTTLENRLWGVDQQGSQKTFERRRWPDLRIRYQRWSKDSNSYKLHWIRINRKQRKKQPSRGKWYYQMREFGLITWWMTPVQCKLVQLVKEWA